VPEQTKGDATFGNPDRVVVRPVHGVKDPAEFGFGGNRFWGFKSLLGAIVIIGKVFLEKQEELLGYGLVHNGHPGTIFFPTTFGIPKIFPEVFNLGEGSKVTGKNAIDQCGVRIRKVWGLVT
jgi:hypothetical protein